MTVHVVCGLDNKLHSVREPSMCVYEATLETPAKCESVKALELQLEKFEEKLDEEKSEL